VDQKRPDCGCDTVEQLLDMLLGIILDLVHSWEDLGVNHPALIVVVILASLVAHALKQSVPPKGHIFHAVVNV